MKTLSLIAILALTAFAQANPQHERFRKEYRASAIATVEAHLKRHKDCELADVLPTLENMQIFFPGGMSVNHHAAAFPRIGAVNPIVFINDELKWGKRQAVVTLIHESTHVTRVKGKWLCGSDRPDAGRGVPCRLFGKTQRDSKDVTRDLEEHLGVELETLDK